MLYWILLLAFVLFMGGMMSLMVQGLITWAQGRYYKTPEGNFQASLPDDLRKEVEKYN